jgi:hypothetical protein
LRAADGLVVREALPARLRDAALAGLRLVLRDCCRVVAMAINYPLLFAQLSGATMESLPDWRYAVRASAVPRRALHDAKRSIRTP